MSAETIIGYLACINITLLQLPQVYKTYTTKKADDLSWGMIFLNVFASVLWFLYGVILFKLPIIIANVSYFLANVSLCYMKIIYRKTILTPTTSHL